MAKKNQSKPPHHCVDCIHLWTRGVKDGKHNRWCCFFGKSSVDVLNHCKTTESKEKKVNHQ